MRTAPTALALEATVPAGPETYRFRTAAGVHSPDSFREAELALLDALWERAPERLLVLQGNYGVVATVLSHAGASVAATEASARSAALCRDNARLNGTDVETTVATGVGSVPVEGVDSVAYAPKPYTPIRVGRARLRTGLAALRPGGDLFLACREREGLARYRTTLDDLAADVRSCDVPSGPPVLHATVDGTAELTPSRVDDLTHSLSPTVEDQQLPLVSAPGLFATNRLDEGTRRLLASTEVAAGEHVLDACCGYAPAGVYAGLTADCTVVASDDGRLATACAERSLDRAGVPATVDTSDCLAGVEGPFDRVLCNPPTHAGEEVLAELFGRTEGLLARDGVCEVVHHAGLSFERHYRPFERERVAADGTYVVDRLTR